MTYAPDSTPAPDRRPALALFFGGLLSGAALVVLALTLTGVIGRPAGGAATPSASGEPTAPAVMQPLVTLPPLAAPEFLTPTVLADGRSLGEPTAPVTIEVWADYQCPYCGLFSQQVEPRIVATYVQAGKARLVFRDLAFLGEESRWAAVAARLAEEQGSFWPYHDWLFANQIGENKGAFAIERLREIAGRVGLEMDQFDAGLQIDAARAAFAEIRAEAEADAAALSISRTPTIVVDGTVIEANDWESIRTAIDAALTASD